LDAYGANSHASPYTYCSIDGASVGEHFYMPLYVLTADHRLEVHAFNANAATFDIRITGMLVNNVSYLPAISQNHLKLANLTNPYHCKDMSWHLNTGFVCVISTK
jgi:hypothetical protein